jgi:hypothetical protein
MAAVVVTALDELLAALGGTGLASTVGRGLLGGLLGVGAADLINFFFQHPGAKSRVPGAKFAIVDMHSNTTIRFLSRKRVYQLLTARKRSRMSRRKIEFVVAPVGETVTRVK